MDTNRNPTDDATRAGACVRADVGPLGRELGFKRPVVFTAAAWASCVRRGATGHDERGRVWDVLWRMHLAVRRAEPGVREVQFETRVTSRGPWPERVWLRAVCDASDDGRQRVTVMLPHEQSRAAA